MDTSTINRQVRRQKGEMLIYGDLSKNLPNDNELVCKRIRQICN
jgi:hypothetical protein